MASDNRIDKWLATVGAILAIIGFIILFIIPLIMIIIFQLRD